ncbi:MAG: hypothetical protein ACW981_09670 [Candidatus Hodarchaeales archaeon]
MTKSHLVVPTIGINELIKIANTINVNIEELNRIIDENFIESIFLQKYNKAFSYLSSNQFHKFWEVLIYFTKGEIETKVLIRYLINPQSSEIDSPSIWDKQIINLSAQMIKHRQKLLELLYDLIINSFKNIQINSSQLGLFYRIQNMNFIIMSAMKKAVTSQSRIHSQTIDDIELSLNSALILGNNKYSRNIEDN